MKDIGTMISKENISKQSDDFESQFKTEISFLKLSVYQWHIFLPTATHMCLHPHPALYLVLVSTVIESE